MMPFTDEQMQAWGYASWRCLADGTVMAVGPMLFGNGRLYIDVHEDGHGDIYCFDSLQRAFESMMNFDQTKDKEPTGWKRHPRSGRRRPGGDASQEYVNP